MLDAHVDALAQLAVAHNLGHFHPKGVAVHVEDDARPPVVEGVGQSLLDRGVRDNVHVVTPLEVHQVPGQSGSALGAVLLGILVLGLAAGAGQISKNLAWDKGGIHFRKDPKIKNGTIRSPPKARCRVCHAGIPWR